MPQPSPPIVVHLSGVPSKLALSITVPVNAASPMCSKVSGRTNSSILPQFSNAAAPMLFMPSGNPVRLNAVHFENAFAPISVTLPGIVILSSSAQSVNIPSGIMVSVGGK